MFSIFEIKNNRRLLLFLKVLLSYSKIFIRTNFIKRNNVSGKDISTVLIEAKTIAKLQLLLSILKNYIERLQKTKKNYYLLNPNTNNYQQKQLLPLGLPEHYYRY